jgi:transposase-like protein
MIKHRKHYTPEEKVSILCRHLVEKVPVSDLCQEQKLQPTVFYRWLKEFFENGAPSCMTPRQGEAGFKSLRRESAIYSMN